MSSNPDFTPGSAIARMLAQDAALKATIPKLNVKFLGEPSAVEKLLKVSAAQRSATTSLAPFLKSQRIAQSVLEGLRPVTEQQAKTSKIFGQLAAAGAFGTTLNSFGASPLAGTAIGRLSNTTATAAWKNLQRDLNHTIHDSVINGSSLEDLVDETDIDEASADLIEEVVDALVEEAAKSELLGATDMAPLSADTREQLRSVMLFGIIAIWPLLIALGTVDPSVAVMTLMPALVISVALHFLMQPSDPR